MSDKSYLSFDNPVTKGLLIDWWEGLDKMRAERARLRRCRTPSEVVFVSAYHDLRRSLSGAVRIDDEALAAVAGLVAHVRPGNQALTLPEQMAGKGIGKAPVSGLRFRRLLQIDGTAALYTALMRVVHQLDRNVNVADLAQSAYWWNEQTRKRWAFAYYSTAPNEQ